VTFSISCQEASISYESLFIYFTFFCGSFFGGKWGRPNRCPQQREGETTTTAVNERHLGMRRAGLGLTATKGRGEHSLKGGIYCMFPAVTHSRGRALRAREGLRRKFLKHGRKWRERDIVGSLVRFEEGGISDLATGQSFAGEKAFCACPSHRALP